MTLIKQTVFLLLGGNLGDRLFFLDKAKTLLIEKAGEIINKSGIYETEAWGFVAEQKFLNQAVELKT